MDEKELMDFLEKFGEGNRCKFVPWWDVDLEDCIYKYNLFTEEEVFRVTECVKKCRPEDLAALIGQTGFTVFHLLVWCGFYDAAEAALAQGVQADIPGAGAIAGVTPLMAACYRGNLQMVKMLLDKKADSGLCDEKGRNVFHYLAGARIADLANYYEIQKNSMVQREPIAQLLSGDINQKDEEGKTPFEELLKDNNSEYSWALAGIYLEKGANVQGKDEEGNSLLMTAIGKRQITAAFRLMEDKELVNLPNNQGKTPLHLAVERCNLELCMKLLSVGADKNMQDGSGKTPKDKALGNSNGDFKELFTTGRLKLNTLSRLTSNAFAGCSSNQRDGLTMALYLAQKLIRDADTDDDEEMGYIINILYSALLDDEKCQVLDMLQEAGIDFIVPIHVSSGVKCIRDYCLGGNFGVKVIRKFISLGLDMDEPIIKGRTPANIVASLQKRTMMRGKKDPYFEEAAEFFSRESMEYVDDFGTTAMHEAARNDHVDMLRVMIGKGADVNVVQDAPAEAGNTPLHVACIHGRGKTAKFLMESGADDTLQNVNGETPAHLVMKKKFGGDLQARERAEVLEALEHVDIARNDGKTPLILLQDLDMNTIMDLLPILLEKGADVNHADDRGNTALLANTQNLNHCYRGIVKELVRAGADVNAVNKDGNTPLYYALRYGHEETAVFLIKKGADYNHANNEGVTPAQVAAEKGYDTVLGLMTDIGE